MRLQQNKPVIGHTKIIDILKRSVECDRIAHAYLFIGPSQVGKNTVAEWLVRELIVRSNVRRDVNADALAPSFDGTGAGVTPITSHPDVTIIRREIDEKTGKTKKNVSIEQIRALRERLSMSPMLGGRKVAIIEDAEYMNTAASNALLKTLEEPAPDTHIILIASNKGMLPETIFSRCRIIRFGFVAESEIRQVLEGSTVDKKTIEEIVVHSTGRPGKAMQYLKDLNALEEQKQEVREFELLIDEPVSSRLAHAAKMIPKGGDVRDRLLKKFDLWERMLREKMIVAIENPGSKMSLKGIIRAIKSLKDSRRAIEENANPQLALENFLLSFK